jgi:hypothetical protein
MESVGFKEWAMVCEALGRGRQSIILRKGGIAEGRGGFSFRHCNFFLFPTYFHEQPEKVREIDFKFSVRSTDSVEINFFAKLEFVKTITSWKTAQALDPLHVLKNEVVRERFEYDKAPGLQAGFVRVFQVVPSWTFPNRKAYGGCRSWVKLPESPRTLHLEPVMNDGEHGGRRNEFYDIIERARMFAASD